MEALGLALALLAGYIFCNQYPPARYMLMRSKGWAEYGHLLTFGIGFALFSAILVLIADYLNIYTWIFGNIQILSDRLHLSAEQLKFAFWASLCLGQAKLYGYISGHYIKLRKEGAESVANENAFEKLIFDSSDSFKPIQITLTNRKVYVGIVAKTSSPDNAAKTDFFTIFPILSGYRDKDTLSIEFTNSYVSYYENAPNNLKFEDSFKTLIPTSAVISMAYFDNEAFNAINGSHKIETQNADPQSEYSEAGDESNPGKHEHLNRTKAFSHFIRIQRGNCSYPINTTHVEIEENPETGSSSPVELTRPTLTSM